MINVKRLILVFSVLFLGACVTIPAPQSLSQRIAVVEATLTGVLDSAANMVATKRITKDQGKHVLALAEKVDGALALARVSLRAGNADDALGQLRIAQQLLLEIEAMLKAKQPTSRFINKEAYA